MRVAEQVILPVFRTPANAFQPSRYTTMFEFLFNHWSTLFVAAVVFIAWVFAKLMLGDDKMPYRKRASLLTSSELSFYKALNKAVDGRWAIQWMVRIADLLQVAPETPRSQTWDNRIQGERVDFLLCDHETMEPKLAVELVDKPEDESERKDPDQFVPQAFADAGFPLVRIDEQSDYDETALRKVIDEQLGATPK